MCPLHLNASNPSLCSTCGVLLGFLTGCEKNESAGNTDFEAVLLQSVLLLSVQVCVTHYMKDKWMENVGLAEKCKFFHSKSHCAVYTHLSLGS